MYCYLAGALALAPLSPAFAQTTDAAGTTSSDTDGEDTIVVTATERSFRLARYRSP